MIRATFTGAPVLAAGTDPVRRTVAGVAVPWNVPGTVADGRRVIFHPGSLDAAARPVLLRDHDRGRPIGTVVDAIDDGRQMHATGRISATRDGDDALVLAADGALPMFSVGADPTEWTFDDDGTMHVTAADWQELSLLTIGAYTAARVATVTASHHPGRNTMTDTPTTDPDAPDAPDVDDVELDDDGNPIVPADEVLVPVVVAAGARPVPLTAGRHPSAGRRPGPAPSPYAALTLAGLARQINASRHDDRAARYVAAALRAQGSIASGIEAALADVTLVGTNNIGAMYRPAYQAELVDLIGWGTPLIDALRQGDLERGDYPNKSFNKWTTAPIVALQTAEKAAIASGPVKIDPATAAVQTWAGGNDISQQILDLGSPSFVEDYIRAAAIDYAKKSDTYAVTTLLAAATAVAPVPALATPFIEVVAKMVASLSPATTPPGGLFLAMSYDVGVGLIGVKRDDGPAFWDGNIGFGAFTPSTTVGGLSAFIDPNMPAGTYLLGHRQGATWYDIPGTPFNLRAVNVANLGLDVAVYGYGALGIQYPGAFVKTTPVGP